MKEMKGETERQTHTEKERERKEGKEGEQFTLLWNH